MGGRVSVLRRAAADLFSTYSTMRTSPHLIPAGMKRWSPSSRGCPLRRGAQKVTTPPTSRRSGWILGVSGNLLECFESNAAATAQAGTVNSVPGMSLKADDDGTMLMTSHLRGEADRIVRGLHTRVKIKKKQDLTG